MKILFVLRLYSGLEEGLHNRLWEPKGVPTIAKLLAFLDKGGQDILPVFLRRNYGSKWAEENDYYGFINGLKSKVHLLAGEEQFSKWPSKLRRKLALLRQMFKLFRVISKYQPTIVYVDRVNLLFAAILARFSRRKVIWRTLGVLSVMKEQVLSRSLRSRMYQWLYKSPFDYVICTSDGSGGEGWMKLALRKSVPRVALINGIDWNRIPAYAQTRDVKNDITRFLFVGRLEINKGVMEFIMAFKDAINECGRKIYATIVGDGILRAELDEFINAYDLSGLVTIKGSIPHKEILNLYQESDVYVSLNKGGNLSNSNLEAMASGCCIVVPNSNSLSGIDVETDSIFPSDTLYRVNSDALDSVRDSLVYLHVNIDERERRSKRILKIAQKLLPTWDERVKKDLAIIEELSDIS